MIITKKRTKLQFALEVLISSTFLVLALWGIDFSSLWKVLRNANYLWLIPSVMSVVFLLLLKAWRWRLLYYPEYRLPFGSIFTALSAGFFISNILPARLGEVSRVLLIVSEQPVGIARTTATIIIEHLLDLATLLILLLVLLPFISLPPVLTNTAKILGVFAIAGIVVMIFLSFWRTRLVLWMDTVSNRVSFLKKPAVHSFIVHLVDGFAVMRTRIGMLIIGISLFGWVLVIITAWSAAEALKLDVPVVAIIFAVVVTTLGMLIPSSPGYIGVFHYLTLVSLSPFGVARDIAIALALLWHAVNYLTLSATGYIALWIHGTSLGQILKRYREGTMV
ncbi:MAG: lysylphosphatidylglycerol synthase transmembrane domain-containing protein [Proteobacteria bacterium]|nr:lysylphosphatidylglycerol synthase transmembrane domain-containing protein [Pseudomonadota bacterium]